MIQKLSLIRRCKDEPYRGPGLNAKPSNNVHRKKMGALRRQVPLPASRRKDESPVEDDSDQFEEMPDSETNIRRVKVLMGRNEEFKEENARGGKTATSLAAGIK
jgi:hypothetical protein